MLRRPVPAHMRGAASAQLSKAQGALDAPLAAPQAPGAAAPQERRHRSAPTSDRPFTLAGASELIAPATDRDYLLIQNNSLGTMFVSFGKPASDRSIQILAGGNYEPYIPTNQAIYVLGTGNGVIVEG